MPNRVVREGILSSHRVCALGWGAEVFYRRLLNVVDDFGRYYAEPVLLRSACYPLQIDKVRDADVLSWLSDAHAAKLLNIYEIEGKKFLQVIDFRQQIRAQKSKFPAPESGTEVSAQEPPHTHSDKSHPKPSHQSYPEEFELTWKAYPRRDGDNPKVRAFTAYKARLREGHSHHEIHAGVLRYAAWVKSKGREGTETVKQAATFFGPDKAFLEPWPCESNSALLGAV